MSSFSAQQAAHVYVIDDDSKVRRSLIDLMAAANLECHGYESGLKFLEDYQDHGPACLLIDIRMPGISGLNLLERMGEIGIMHPAIMMTGFADVSDAVRAFNLGASGFLEKPFAGSLVLDHVGKALETDRVARTKRLAAETTRSQLSRLSSRERQVLSKLMSGMLNKEIAWELGLSEKTIAAHRSNLLSKMGATSIVQLATQVANSGLDASLSIAMSAAA